MTNGSSPERHATWVQGMALVLPVTTVVMGSAILAPNIPQMIGQFSAIPNVQYWVPAMVTVPSLCLALFSPVAGAIADAIGRRRVMIWAMIAYGLLGMLPLVVHNFWIIFASRIGVGIMEAFVLTASSVLIGDYFTGARRDHWLAMQTTVASLSAMVMFPLGGLVGQFGWQYPFAMYALLLLLLPLVIRCTWEPPQMARAARRKTAWGPMGAIALSVALVCYLCIRWLGVIAPLAIYILCLVVMLVIGKVTAKSAAPQSDDGSSWRGFPWLPLTGICVITAAASLMFYLLQINMAQVLVEGGVTSLVQTGLIISLVSLGIPLGTIAFSRLSRTPISILLLVDFALIAVGFFGMSAAPSLPVLLAFATLNQFGCGMALPTLLTWAMRQFSFAQRGRGVGIWQGFFNGGQFVGVSFITLVASSFTAGRITPAFGYIALLAAVVAAGAGAAILLRKGVSRVAYVEGAAPTMH